MQSFPYKAFAYGRASRRIRVPELKNLGTSYSLVAGSAGFRFDFVADFFRVRGRFLSGAPFARSRFGFWLLPARTLAAFAMLRVPYAASSRPDTF